MSDQKPDRETALPDGSGKNQNGVGKKWLWSIVFIAIAALSVRAVTAQSKNISASEFFSYLSSASVGWLIVAVLCMGGFIFFEAFAVLSLCRAFGYRKGLRDGFLYSASDLYFSAITPSATGGQPASAFFMIRSGIPGVSATVVLIANLFMYTLSIIAIGILCFALRPGIFLSFGTPSRILIIVGCVMQAGLAVFFLLLLIKDRLVHKICDRVLLFLGKIRLLRHPERKRDKLVRTMEDYRRLSVMIRGHSRTMALVFLWNFLQRASQIAVTAAVYMAGGGDASRVGDIFAMQSYVVLGSNCMPIPGAMGVADYLMLDGFGSIMPEDAAVNLELLSRSISFYFCIGICGIAVLCAYFYGLKKEKNK